ncbi:MAG: alkaline phosphatase D family protein [Deltaproteobacteria bacterium]|nr:alkaline phosphatase D family protein [Deltaproteobacteria bacterium]
MLRDPTARACVIALVLLAGCESEAGPREDAVCLENVALGEMSSRSAVLWAREETRGYLHARVPGGDGRFVAPFLARYDHTARVRLRDLAGSSELVVWASDGPSAEETPPDCAPRQVRLAPEPNDPTPLRFAFGGDVAGQNVCRDRAHGFPTLPELTSRAHDFRILLGDMIYADDTCLEEGALGNVQVPMDSPPLPSLEAYRAHWRYAEDDAAYRALRWGAYAVWDDHEIVNDAGPHHDHVRRGRGQHVSLLPIGRRGLLEHDALDLPPSDTSTPLHRRFRWGRHLELVLLDTRSHRDDDAASDDGPEPKTMLGRAQREWLADLLRSSDASWIVIVSSVPIALPTGANGRRDSWASGDTDRGFVRELRGLFEVARRAGRRELVFLTTDVHFTAAFEHHPFEDDPGFVVHELVTGPLSAGLFPFDAFDTTLGTERVLHFVPDEPVRTLRDARPYFTWGEVEIDREGALTLSARNADEEVWRATLLRAPRSR